VERGTASEGCDGSGCAKRTELVPASDKGSHNRAGFDSDEGSVDVSYVPLQVHEIVNVALHREYSPGILFIFSQWRKNLYHV
jgi:superfamily II RNA helicase